MSDYCIKIQAPITGEGIAGKKKSRMTNRNVCTNVTAVFKTNGRKGHFFFIIRGRHNHYEAIAWSLN